MGKGRSYLIGSIWNEAGENVCCCDCNAYSIRSMRYERRSLELRGKKLNFVRIERNIVSRVGGAI